MLRKNNIRLSAVWLWMEPGQGELLNKSSKSILKILEETGISVRTGEMVYQLEYIEHDKQGAIAFHYVVLDYAAEYLAGEPCAGDDAEEAAWVRFDELAALPLTDSTREALHTLFVEEFPR